MPNKPITIVIEGRTYRLSVDHPEAVRHMPANDKEALIALLGMLKLESQSSEIAMQAAIARTKPNDSTQSIAGASEQPAPVERLGAGDIDAIAEKLMNDERKKPVQSLRPVTLYKWMAVIIVVIALMVWMF